MARLAALAVAAMLAQEAAATKRAFLAGSNGSGVGYECLGDREVALPDETRCRSKTNPQDTCLIFDPTCATALELTNSGLFIPQSGVAGSSLRNAPVTETFVVEGVNVWKELRDSRVNPFQARLTNVPPLYFNDRVRYSLSVPTSTTLKKDMTYDFRCGREACEVVIFLYECHPCESKKGGLPAKLLQDGFIRTRCAPTFTNGRSNTNHQLIAYSKLIDGATYPNFVYQLHLEEDVEFLMAAFSEAAEVDCSIQGTQAECEDTYGRCLWRGGRCHRNTCIQVGPGTGCDTNTCLKKELF